MILSLAEMAGATGGRLVGDAAPGRVCTDTRALRPGDWFLALVGDRFDAHDFLDQADAAGVAGVIVQRVPEGWTRGALVVDDTLLALQDLARAARARFDGRPVIGLTGSAGKTTTRAMIAAALGSLGVIHQNEGNLNNHIGVPLTLLAAPDDAAALVLEMGMSGPGEIELLQDIGRPTVRLVTNVAAAHLEGVGSLDGVAACKAELVDGARPGDRVFLNADDPRVDAMAVPEGAQVQRYGSSIRGDVRLLEASVDPDTLATTAVIATAAGTLTATLAAPGRHLAHNAAAAAAIAHALGVAPADIAAGLAGWRPVGMRMRVERRRLGEGRVTVINDAYNANPLSTRVALDTLTLIGGARRVALLGDMLELGDAEDTSHDELVAYARTLDLDLVGFAGPRYTAAVARALRPSAEKPPAAPVVVADSAHTLREVLAGRLLPGDIVLIKGSRGMRMERTLQDLLPEED